LSCKIPFTDNPGTIICVDLSFDLEGEKTFNIDLEGEKTFNIALTLMYLALAWLKTMYEVHTLGDTVAVCLPLMHPASFLVIRLGHSPTHHSIPVGPNRA